MTKKKTRTLWAVRTETDSKIFVRPTALKFTLDGIVRGAAGAGAYFTALGATYAIAHIPEIGDAIQAGVSYLSERLLHHPATLNDLSTYIAGIYGFRKTKLEIDKESLGLEGLSFGNLLYYGKKRT